MQSIKEIIIKDNEEFLAWRNSAEGVERRAKDLKTMTTWSMAYAVLAPILVLSFKVATDVKSVLTEFAFLFIVNYIPVILWMICRNRKRYSVDNPKGLERRGRFLQHDTWLEVAGMYTWSMWALHLSVKEGNGIRFTPWLVVAMMVVAIYNLNVYESIVLNLAAVLAILIQIKHFEYALESKAELYNVIVFAIVLTYFMICKYLLFAKEFMKSCAMKQLQEEREKFMVNMTHEMRTPLTAVLGKNELIYNDTAEPETKVLASEIASSGKILMTIINDLLDFSKMTAGKMNITPADYPAYTVTYELRNLMKSEAEKKGLQFNVEIAKDIPSKLYGDDVRIRQVIINLLSNAIKYTQEGFITFRAWFDEDDNNEGYLHVAVEDTGMGIKEEDLPKLTRAFSRVNEDQIRNIRGTGLGLAITSSLLQLMGSELKIESTYRKGSVFSFAVKQGIVDATPLTDKAVTEEIEETKFFNAPEAKVLVVDDNRTNYAICKGLMKYYGFTPVYAESGEKCLELLGKNEYDLVFIDHMMPELSGPETLERIKKETDVYKKIPIIALTANDGRSIEKEYVDMGFDGYLAKPIDSKKLHIILKQTLKNKIVA